MSLVLRRAQGAARSGSARFGVTPFLCEVEASVHGAIDPAALLAEGVDLDAILDFSSNQSPLGAAPNVAAAVSGAVVDAYPDPRATALVEIIAEHHRVPSEAVVAGNGSTELIRLLAQLALRPDDVALALAPVFGECAVGTALAGVHLERVALAHAGDGAGFRCDAPALLAALAELSPRLCWLCSPNNPTGSVLSSALITSLVSAHPETLFVLDEAYCDLLDEPQWSPDLLVAGNLVVLRSMTKYWGLAGLRLGYAIADISLTTPLRAAAPPWNVNACAQAAGVAALADLDHHARALGLLRGERDRMVASLRRAGWTVEPTKAGFFLIRVGDAAATRTALLSRGCLVRDCTSFGLPEHVRVSPRHEPQNERLLAAFAALTPPEAPQ